MQTSNLDILKVCLKKITAERLPEWLKELKTGKKGGNVKEIGVILPRNKYNNLYKQGWCRIHKLT